MLTRACAVCRRYTWFNWRQNATQDLLLFAFLNLALLLLGSGFKVLSPQLHADNSTRRRSALSVASAVRGLLGACLDPLRGLYAELMLSLHAQWDASLY